MKITAILFSLFLLSGFLWADHDDDIGYLYLREAAFLYEAGDYAESEKLLGISDEFISDNSDLSFLRGMIEKQKNLPLRRVELHFKSAMTDDNWQIYSAADLASAYIPLLFRTKNYGNCLEMLSNPELNKEPTAHFIWIHGKALQALGRQADAVDIVKEGLAFYPDSSALYALLFELAPIERARYSELLLNGTINHPGLKEILLPSLIPLAEKNLAELFFHYDESRLFDPECEIKRIKAFGKIDNGKLKDLSERGVFNEGRLIRELRSALPFNSQRAEFDDLFAEWSGLVEEDENGDGLAEYRIYMDRGEPSSFYWDPDQDGVNAVFCEYEDGILQTMLLSGVSDVFIEYELYPWVRRVTRRDDERILVYNIALGRYAIDFPSIVPMAGIPEISLPTPLWSEVQDVSRSVLVYSSSNESPLEEYIPLFNGRGRKSGEPGQDGEYNRRFYIRDGRIEYMEADLTGASGWDTIGYYQGGLLRLIAHDAREDGIYEYAESAGGAPAVNPGPGDGWFYWDFNQNGFYDCRQRRIDGRLLREYSSADNGEYDILIEIEDD